MKPRPEFPQVLGAMLSKLDPHHVLAPTDAAVDEIGRLLREGLLGVDPALPIRSLGLAPAGHVWLRLTEAAGSGEVQRTIARASAAWTAQWATGDEVLLAIGAGPDGIADVAIGMDPAARPLWLNDMAPDLLWVEGVPAALAAVAGSFESTLHPRPMPRAKAAEPDDVIPGLTRLLSLSLTNWVVVLRLRSVAREAVASAQGSVVQLQRELGRRLSSSASTAHNETTAVEDPQVKAILEMLLGWQSHLRSCSSGGAWQASMHCIASTAVDLAVIESAASALLGSATVGADSAEQWWSPQTVSTHAQYGDCTGWLSAEDLGALLVPPREATGSLLVRNPLPAGRRRSATPRPIPLGQWLGTDLPAVIDVDDLAGHAFVAGITGSGKSTTTARLLTTLWNDHRIPFLVIDPAKADYEDVAPHLDGGLRVISGEDLAMNVLTPWPGQPARRHIARVSSAFRGAFGMPVPVPYVASMLFEQLADDTDSGGATLHDASARLDALVADLGYSGEIEDNIRASLGLRLRLLLQPRRAERVAGVGAPEWLTERPTLVQLGDLGDDEERAFLAAMLVLYIADAARARGGSALVQHVTVIEEAHRLMPEPRSVSAEEGDAGAVASRLMAQLLAEVRGNGEAVLVVDQSPAAVAREVIRNTSIKLAHRVVDIDDQRVLGGALGLPEADHAMLGSLTPGRCLVSTRGLLRPQVVSVARLPNARRDASSLVGIPLADAVCHRAGSAMQHHASEPVGADAELAIGLWAIGGTGDPVEVMQRLARSAPGARPSCLIAIGVRRYIAGLTRIGQLPRDRALGYAEVLQHAAVAGSEPPTHPADEQSRPLPGCEHCPQPCRSWSLVAAGVVPGQRRLATAADRSSDSRAAVAVIERGMADIVQELQDRAGVETAEALAFCTAVHAAAAVGAGRRFIQIEQEPA